jgi:hypothetical protein
MRRELDSVGRWYGAIPLCGDQVDVRVSRAAGQIAVTTLNRIGQVRVASVS